jgi:hypothetical protein
LWSKKEYEPEGLTQSFFRTRNGKTVISSRTTYRNGENDRRTTEFDKSGKALFSVRMEEVSDTHLRRYDNDVLVLEAKWSKSNKPAPDVKYYDGKKVFIDYESRGKGKGTYSLYRVNGSVEATLETDREADNNKYGNWNAFLPGFAQYEKDRKQTDVQFARKRFLERVERVRFEEMLTKLEIPSKWKAIRDVEWKKSGAASDASQLGKLIVLLLGNDKKLAKRAANEIWWKIEQQDCVFTATYDVAQTLTRLLPLLAGGSLTRVITELAKIVCLPDLPHDKPKRFKALVAELK